MMTDRSIMKALMEVIAERKANPPAERSYVVGPDARRVAKIGARSSKRPRRSSRQAMSTARPAASTWLTRSPTLCFTRRSCWDIVMSPGAPLKTSWRGGLESAGSPRKRHGGSERDAGVGCVGLGVDS